MYMEVVLQTDRSMGRECFEFARSLICVFLNDILVKRIILKAIGLIGIPAELIVAAIKYFTKVVQERYWRWRQRRQRQPQQQ